MAHEDTAHLTSGICNWRDLGGLPIAGGGHTRHGKVFRSGVLAYMTTDDHISLDTHRIRTIVDLRRTDEITHEPTRWPGSVHIISFVEDASIARAQAGAPWERTTEREDVLNIMRSAYASMSDWLQPHLSAIFQAIAASETPLVLHCAAGKDRTGLCAAVLLSALGVPRESIIEEYQLTNAFDLKGFASERRSASLGVNVPSRPLPHIEAALLHADSEYLCAGLDAIDTRFGSMVAYVRDHPGIDEPTLARVRHALIESA